MRHRFAIAAAFALIALIATALLVACNAPARLTPAAALAPAPLPITAPALLDKLGARTAGVALVNVWATYCVPCREEFPLLLALREKYRPRGLELVLVSADFHGQVAQAQQFLTEQKVDFPTYIKDGPDQAFIDGLEPRWSGALPATLLFGPGGKPLDFTEGEVEASRLEEKIVRALAAAAQKGETT